MHTGAELVDVDGRPTGGLALWSLRRQPRQHRRTARPTDRGGRAGKYSRPGKGCRLGGVQGRRPEGRGQTRRPDPFVSIALVTASAMARVEKRPRYDSDADESGGVAADDNDVSVTPFAVADVSVAARVEVPPPGGMHVFLSDREIDIAPNTPLPVKMVSVLGGNRIENELDNTSAMSAGKRMQSWKLKRMEGALNSTIYPTFESAQALLQKMLDLLDGLMGNLEAPLEERIQRLYNVSTVQLQTCKNDSRESMQHTLNEKSRAHFVKFQKAYWVQAAIRYRFPEQSLPPSDLQRLYHNFFRVSELVFHSVGAAVPGVPCLFCCVPAVLDEELLAAESDAEELSTLLELKLYLRTIVNTRMLRRVGTDVMEPVYVNQSVYATAYRPLMSIEDWVCSEVGHPRIGMRLFSMFEGDRSAPTSIVSFFTTRAGMQPLQYCRYLFSFRNGVYFLPLNRFTLHADMASDLLPTPEAVSCSYFDVDFDVAMFNERTRIVHLPLPRGDLDPDVHGSRSAFSIPTPALDKLMQDQRWSYRLQVSNLVLLGRVMYDSYYLDNMQRIPFFYGRKETGKSTFCKLVEMFYPYFMKASFSHKVEEVFGLQGFIGKSLVTHAEVRSTWTFPLPDFLKMVSNDTMNVNRKNTTQVSMIWRASMMLSGNEYPGWIDESMAAARRFFFFPFKYTIEKDENLLKRLEAELPYILMKINTFYLAWVHSYRNRLCEWPVEFDVAQNDFIRETNPLYRFILDPDVLVRRPGLYMPFTEVLRAYKEYRKTNHTPGSKMTLSEDTWRSAFGMVNVTLTEERSQRRYPRHDAARSVEDLWVDGVDCFQFADRPTPLLPRTTTTT
jgi:hypothetical protein